MKQKKIPSTFPLSRYNLHTAKMSGSEQEAEAEQGLRVRADISIT